MPMPRLLAPAVTAFLALALASGASAATGRNATPGVKAPEMTRQMAATGRLCRLDSGSFTMWWSEAAGGAHTVQGSDGSCRTVPAVVSQSLAAAGRGQAVLRTMGYPALRGDAAPTFTPQPSYFRYLRSLDATTRTRVLSRTKRATRGRILASFTAAQRKVVNRGLPFRLRAVMAKDLRTALTGTAADYVGGNRRVDVVLTASTTALGSRDGVSPCLSNRALRGARRFVSTSMVVVTPDAGPNTATLSHELFHTFQCSLGMLSSSELLMEGTAEWASARIDATSYAEAIVTSPAGGRTVGGGTARAIAFCTRFTPQMAAAGTDGYRSFAVWAALEAAEPGITRRILIAAVAEARTTPEAVMDLVGEAKWSSALRTAVTSVCGALQVPGTEVAFPPEMRSFLVSNGVATAAPGVTANVVVPGGGVQGVNLRWDSREDTAMFLVTSPDMPPAELAGQIVASTRSAPISVNPVAGGVLVTVPGGHTYQEAGSISIASPGTRRSLTVSVRGL